MTKLLLPSRIALSLASVLLYSCVLTIDMGQLCAVMRSWCGGDVPLVCRGRNRWSDCMGNYSIAERAILRWLADGEIITIDKHDHRQRELWLMLKGLMNDKLVEIAGQNRQQIIYRLAAAMVYERAVGEN